jgi:hypothetical protein
MDRPDLYYEPHRQTGGAGSSENYPHTRAATGIVRWDPPPEKGWWPTDEERRQVRILGYIGIAVTHLLTFGLGWALGWALT